MRIAPRIIVSGLALSVCIASAGSARADAELWTEVGAKWEAREGLAVSLDQDLRFDAGVSRLGALITEPGIGYRFASWFKASASYRFQYERDKNDVLVVRHRLDLGVSFRANLGDLRLEYEPQLQEEARPTSNDTYRHVIRNGFGAEWRGWKPYYPAASVEIFHELDNPDTVHLDKIWITLRTDWVRKQKEVSVFYRAELPQYAPMDPTIHIFGVAFHYEL